MKINFVLLRKLIKWNVKRDAFGLVLNKSVNDQERLDDTSVEITDKKDTDRRLLDTLSRDHPKRKMNLDRRAVHSDRRVDADSHYKGTARRYTIDRRLNLKDRREKG